MRVSLLNINSNTSRLKLNQKIVYLNFLSTAPWNRSSIQSPRFYQGVGTTLLTFAAVRSIELGFQGRVGLHSIPETEDFYKNFQMIDCGKDANYHNLTYLEMLEEDAEINILNLLLINELA